MLGGAPASRSKEMLSGCHHYFEIQEQPYEKQRKSYKKENRYLLPNPMVVTQSNTFPGSRGGEEGTNKIKNGTVTVKLVYESGEDLEEERRGALDGKKTTNINVLGDAPFHLKVLETSDRVKFRLHFTARFVVDGKEMEETILSNSFRVTTNKKVVTVDVPRPIDIKPSSGYNDEATEIWIRGTHFTDRSSTMILFGEQEARVEETESNFLVCYAPPRDDLEEDTTVDVAIVNRFDGNLLPAKKLMKYTYLVTKRKKSKRSSMDDMENEAGTNRMYDSSSNGCHVQDEMGEKSAAPLDGPPSCPCSPMSVHYVPQLEDQALKLHYRPRFSLDFSLGSC